VLTSQYYLKDSLVRLRTIRNSIKEKTDLGPLRSKCYTVLYEMCSALEEAFFMTERFPYKDAKEDARKAVNSIRNCNDFEEFIGILDIVLRHFEEDQDFNELQFDSFSEKKTAAITKYSPIGGRDMEKIGQSMGFNKRTVNIFDPRCRDGQNIGAIKRHMSTAVAYGIETEASVATKAKDFVDRMAMGTLSGSRISNDAFDLMLIETPVSWILPEIGPALRQEKEFFRSTIKYLRPGGVCVFVIPYFKMYKDMCIMLAKNLKKVQVRKCNWASFDTKGLITIIGVKDVSKEPDEEIYTMLRKLHTVDDVPSFDNKDLEPIRLPDTAVEIETFRGSILDYEEMAFICSTSGCMDSFWTNQNVEKINENIKQPLLPFNIGQIGLVLTSGCLDGIVDEGEGFSHVIKGRVSKQSNVERDLGENNLMEVVETVSNRVEISVILPNGEYKVLA
jgi:hypothetical protein